MNYYSADNIKVNKRPEIKHISDDIWNQVWDIVLKKSISETTNQKIFLINYPMKLSILMFG